MNLILCHYRVHSREVSNVLFKITYSEEDERTMTVSEILIKTNNNVATITLNRPEVRNAFNLTMIDQMERAIKEVKQDKDVKVLVLTGSGQTFCSGGDINEIKEFADKAASKRKDYLKEGIHKISYALLDFDKPVIGALNGSAMGAGLDLALLCDLRVSTMSAKFGETYIKMGLVPGNGGTYLLPRLVGWAKAFELFYTADVINADEAKRIGLVNQVYADDEFRMKIANFAEKIAKGPPIQLAMIKRQLMQSIDKDLKEHLDLASSNMSIALDTEDRREAFQAFKEKRKPNFTGM